VDAKTRQVQTFPVNGPVGPENDIRCMLQAKNGNIWYGTNGAGVYCMDANNRAVLHLEKKYDTNEPAITYNYIRSLYQDSKGYIWIGATLGLTRYNPKTNEFVNFYERREDANSLNSNCIYSILETSNGQMCFATAVGICILQTPVWDEKYDALLGYDNSAVFKNYSTLDGLPDPSVFSIVEDNQQHVWIGTGKGLSMFDLKTSTFKNYAIEGSFNEVFNASACYKDATGCLYFGSLRGLVYFYPDSISVATDKQNVIITDIKVNFESILDIKNEHFVDNELVMKADERAINVEFSALEMLYPNTIKYQYKLDGFDENWNLTDASRRYATYTNLNPGHYTLLIKATNKNGVWMEKPTELAIYIKPPFWKTIWFYFLSLSITFSILFGTYRYRIAAIQRRNMQLEVLVESRTEELFAEREKQKIQELENKEMLLKQKELEAENLRAEKELIQLKNEKLQHEIEIQNLEMEKKSGELVSAAVQISQKIEFLARLKNSLAQVLEKTSSEKHEMISALIKQIEKDADIRKEWEQFEQHFNQANNNFLKILKERYPDLTPLDLRICGYLRMNLSNKEIAALHNISLSGVEKSRFRLRKKLRLDNSENIITFLMGIS
jgi:DNA-binding CsgD family transcriptional regulator